MPPAELSAARLPPRFRLPRVLALLLSLLLGLCAGGVVRAAEQEPPAKSTAAEAKPAAPAAIPLAEMSVQAEAATVTLKEIQADAALNDAIDDVEKNLPGVTSSIDARVRENARIMSQQPSFDLLRTLETGWQTQRETLSAWTAELDRRVAALDRDLSRIDTLEKTWRETQALAQKEQAPPELLKRIEDLLGAIAAGRKDVESRRAHVLRIQSRVAAQVFKITTSLESIRSARAATLSRIGRRDSPALWRVDQFERATARISADSQESRATQVAALKTYVQHESERFVLHAVLVALIAFLLYRVRRWIIDWSKIETGLERAAAVFAMPLATGLVLSLIAARWIYPQAPRLMWAIIGAFTLVPTVVVLRPIVPRYLLPFLYAIVGFYLVDQVRIVTASLELVPRLVFLAEMLAGAVFLTWFLRSIDTNGALPNVRPGLRAFIRFGAQVGSVFFIATAIANALGYVALANLLGGAVLRGLYLGVILYTLAQILDALVLIALRVRPLGWLNAVRTHHELLRTRIRLGLNVGAFLLWLSFVLDRLAIRDVVFNGAGRMLSAEVRYGALKITAGDVLAFVFAVWASFLVSRFVRFVLEEEIFPHARLKRGLPYAISRTVHYLILIAGFFVAMAALGLDMTKFTILAGAFTVGVGFGLQNIFNNFVSGLILLFERPMQVGDLVQMDDASGVVQRIGIRASIVRASNGSEIIVPNGKLISERLVNWTLSERQRGIEVAISVMLDSDPGRVIGLLERVASAHPDVVKRPEPRALLTRIGPDYMGFELRAATGLIEDWMRVRSDLAVAATAALTAEQIKLR